MRGPPGRILLKLSGEAFKDADVPLSANAFERIAHEVAPVHEAEVAVVVGGGNLLRGGRTDAYDRIEADALGMLGTVLNALAFRAHLERAGRTVMVQSAIQTELTDPIDIRIARTALASGSIVVFAGGTGSPLVSTDTAAAIRAVSIRADLLAKASNVSGVFTSDPATNAAAERLTDISFEAFLDGRYGVMDQVAVEICREHHLPIEVFDFSRTGALRDLAAGVHIGTRIG